MRVFAETMRQVAIVFVVVLTVGTPLTAWYLRWFREDI